MSHEAHLYYFVAEATNVTTSTMYGAPGSPQWTRAAAAAAAAGGKTHTYSNGVVGAVIAAPLLLLGMWLQHKSVRGSAWDSTRPHGLLHPPQNPYLREDLKPKTYSRFWNQGWNGGRGKRMEPPVKKSREATPATAAVS